MAARLIALALLALSLLPFANLIPGGEDDPEYWARLFDWTNGTLLCVGVAVLAVYLRRIRRRKRGASQGPAGQVTFAKSSSSTARDRAFVVTVMIGAGLLYAGIATFVFSRRPLLIDEVVQVLQARWYADGQLSVPVSPHREFFSIMHVVDLGDRVFGQFPAGGPAMLALGSLIGAEWLVGPATGALSVGLFYLLLGHVEPGASRRWRRGATMLFALAPFGAFMFGSHMNHVTTLLWLLIATVALARATAAEDASPGWGLLTGVALGAAATIRPLDAVAFAVPAALWLLWRARRGGRPLASLLLSGIGIAGPLAVLLWVNAQTTGRPTLFGYDLLWGSGHSIGFHTTPWGPVHTPARGVELISLYFTRLSSVFLESPFPALLLPAGALWLAPRLRGLDRYLLVTGATITIGYWAYWHDGNFLGPRFFVPLLPLLVLWTSRFPSLVAERIGRASDAWFGLRVAGGVAAALTVVSLAVLRVPEYRNGLTSMRVDIERQSASVGVRNALVLVKESWGARLVVRMWALGVPRSETEMLYRKTDACKLELAVSDLERAGTHGASATERLMPLLVDSLRVIRSERSTDVSEGQLPGLQYPAECERQIASDWRGYSHLAPFRLAKDGNVYARWLPGREAEIAAAFPDRPVYRLVRGGIQVDAPLVWERLSFRSDSAPSVPAARQQP